MKINNLLENITPTSNPDQGNGGQAPKFGRSDKVLEDDTIEENTTSGSVASVDSPMGGMQRRGKGSMFAGISTSEKYPNSKAVKEEQINEVDPRNFDSDEDYYAARNAPAKPRSQARQSPGVNQDDEAYFREIFRKKRLAAQQAERSADHDRLATGTNEGEVEEAKKANTKTARKEFGNRVSSKPKLSDKEQLVKKDNSDKLWAMLQQHIADTEKNKEVEEGQRWPDSSNSLAKRKPVVAFNNQGVKAGRPGGMTVSTRVEPTITSTKVQRKDDRPIPSFLQKGVAEGREVDASVVIGKLYDIIDHAEDAIKNADYDRQVQYVTVVRDRAVKALNMIKTNPSAAEAAWKYFQNGEQEQVTEKSKSQAQFRTMAAVAHNPKFAKKVGISQKVGKEFHSADRKQDYKDLPKEVDEASFDYTMKDLGNDYAGFPSNHSLKHKFLARIKPEKQQLYKDKMNNMHEFDQLFQLFTVAKQRGDIIEQGVTEMDGDSAGRSGGEFGKEHTGKQMKAKDAVKHAAKWLTEPQGPQQELVRNRAKNIAKIRKNKEQGVAEEKQRLDPKCWSGYKKQGTKMKGGTRVNNCVPIEETELNETDMLAKELFKQLELFKKGADKDIGSKAKDRDISNKAKDKDIVTKEASGEYDDEAGSSESNLLTTARAVKGLIDTIDDRDNLPEWVQEKIAKAEGMLVASWDYLQSQKEQGIDPQVDEDWQKANKSDKTDGMSPKAVKAYRRENPGSKLKTAVTKKPSELKAGSKDANRRKSFCARMSGNKGPMKDEKGRPTPKAKALSRWNC